MNRNSRWLTDLPIISPRRARGGFTMLEMLIAIGIILVLLAIGVIGFRALDSAAAKKETFSTLSNLQSLMAELESTAGLGRLEGPQGVYGPGAKIVQPNQGSSQRVPNPGDVNPGSVSGDRARYGHAVRQTQRVIEQLMHFPKNKTIIAQFPSKRLLGKAPTGYANAPDKVVVNDSSLEPTPVVPLDGWRNPILFVPSGGLDGVNLGARPAGGFDETNKLIELRNNPRPFWVSAGPDGNFTTGDDNIYSFSKQ